jgi:hypothetical protein
MKGEWIMVMTSEKKKEMVERVMKLLALGDEKQNDNPHERENAQRLVAKLMAEYSLDFADLKANAKREDVFARFDVPGAEGIKVNWEFSLAGNVAKVFDCKVIGNSQQGWNLTFLGTKSDLEIAIFFFKYLRRTAGVMSERRYPHIHERNNYAFGMVITLGERLDELFKKREEFIPSSCKDLMVIKKEDLSTYVHEQFPRLKHSHFNIGKDAHSYHAGRADGHRVNLSRPMGSGGTRAAIGA